MSEQALEILLVEDDRFLATALNDKLTRAGYKVLWAHNGEEALNKLNDSTPALILLDLIMPQMNGFEFLTRLNARTGGAKMPVIVLSNLGQESDMAKAKSLGAVDYLIKSDVQLKEIIERVKKHLRP